jgi:hypothetical protein
VRTGEVAPNGDQDAQILAEAQARIFLLDKIYKQILQRGANPGEGDYNIIPGCGPKPTLLKPGAEKILAAFRLSSKIKEIITNELPGGHREITVITQVVAPDGTVIAEGGGTCSSMESKYRYIRSEPESTGVEVPRAYWDVRKENPLQAQELIGEGNSIRKIEGRWLICSGGVRVERLDVADVYNTILKMAKKRSLMDATLSGTGASSIFTQDIEDMVPQKGSAVQNEPTKEQEPSEPSPQASHQPPTEPGDTDKTDGGAMTMRHKIGDELGQEFWNLRRSNPRAALAMLPEKSTYQKIDGKWLVVRQEA